LIFFRKLQTKKQPLSQADFFYKVVPKYKANPYRLDLAENRG
jgi:hypothetical protein